MAKNSSLANPICPCELEDDLQRPTSASRDLFRNPRKGRIRTGSQQQAVSFKWRLPARSDTLLKRKGGSKLASQRHLQHHVSIPVSLGESVVDLHNVFERIGSAEIKNIVHLWYWLSVSDPGHENDEGWLGGVKQFYGELLFRQGPCEAAFLSLLAYIALRKKGDLTSVSTERVANRAKTITIQEIKDYKNVTGTLLVIIGNLALMAMSEGDLKAAKAHWEALARLSQLCTINTSQWAFSYGIDVRLAANLLVKPKLPYYIPPEWREPLPLSADEIARGVRLGSKNTLAFSKLLGADYLQAQKLFVGLHHHFQAFSIESADQLSPAIYGQIYNMIYHTTAFVSLCKSQITSPITQPKELLAIAIELVFWRTVEDHIPQEGFIQRNLLGRATALIQLQRNMLVSTWSSIAHIEGLVWIAANMALEASIWYPESSSPWIDVLGEVLRKQGISSEKLQHHVQEWPYASTLLDTVANDLWLLVKEPEKLHSAPSKSAAARKSLLL